MTGRQTEVDLPPEDAKFLAEIDTVAHALLLDALELGQVSRSLTVGQHVATKTPIVDLSQGMAHELKSSWGNPRTES